MAIGIRSVIVEERVSPAFDGLVFEGVGAFEILKGRLVGELDPGHALNAGIVNLDKAPRNERGCVEYQVDFEVMQPVEPARGNGWIFYEVLNRGSKRALERINGGGPSNSPRHRHEVGNAFLMRQGFTLVWTGWQGELAPAPGLMTARFPVALDGGQPITGRAREEFIAEGDGATFVGSLVYPAADLDPSGASLSVRERERDQRATPPGLAWRFLDERHIEVDRPEDPAYDKGAIYEFIYTARDPIVSGIAFASVRDAVAWFRTGAQSGDGSANPLVGGRRRAMMFGLSQSGRFARDFLYQGFNQTLDGDMVFDAVTPLIAGSRKSFVNYPFAQPGRYPRQHEDHTYPGDQFPFTYTELHDPISGKRDSILRRSLATGTTPKIMHFDTDSELWSARASLVVTDCEGRDVELPDNVRVYLAAGLQHGTPGTENLDKGSSPTNPIGYGALMRPLLVALRRWVDEGIEPPASRFPRRRDGTLVSLDKAREQFPKIPGVAFPEVVNELELLDHARVPPVVGPSYPVFVSSVDADGNALAGIRHPLLDVPLATHTGWNVRAPGYAAGDLAGVLGSMLLFAESNAERQALGDPRASIEQRYASRSVLVRRLRVAAQRLVAEGLLLAEDADRLVAVAEAGGDVFDAL